MDARAEIIAEAKTWLGTPFHHRAAAKGRGVDCGQFVRQVFINCGLVNPDPVPDYAPAWALHSNNHCYLDYLRQYAREVEALEPGNIAVFRFGRDYSHGSIIVKWPLVIHAHNQLGVVMEDASNGTLEERPFVVYSVL